MAGRPRRGETAEQAASRRSTGDSPPSPARTPKLRTSAEPARPRSPRRSRKPTAASIRKTLIPVLGGIQEAAFSGAPPVLPPLLPGLREDELNPQELELLSEAFAAEILANKWLLDLYIKIASGSVTGPHARLGATLLLIMLPRLGRRGIVPQQIAGAMTAMVAMVLLADEGQASDDAGPGAIPAETGGAHPDHGSNGVGQIGDGQSIAGPAAVPDLLPFEDGRHPMGHGPSDDDFAFVPQRNGGRSGGAPGDRPEAGPGT